MKGSSRATVFVAAIPKCQRTRLVRPSHQLQELDDGNRNVFMHGLFDRYAARPTGAPFDDMTLAHFAVWYKTVSGGEDDETEVFHVSSCKMAWVQLLREAIKLA